MLSRNTISIVGCPRSGTTLLAALLNRHPDIVTVPETKLWSTAFRLSKRHRKDVLERISRELSMQEVRSLGSHDSEYVWRWICDHFPTSIDRGQAKYVINKVPEQRISILKSELTWDQGNKTILMVRDGYAVADSLTRMPWVDCDHGSAAAIWNYLMSQMTKIIDSPTHRRDQPVHIVRYEELITDPVRVLNNTLEYLQVETTWTQRCLEPNDKLDRYVFPAREAAWKARSILPIDADTNNGQTPISTQNLHRIEQAARPMLRRWDYTRCLPKLSTRKQFSYRLHNTWSTFRTAIGLPPRMLTESFLGRYR